MNKSGSHHLISQYTFDETLHPSITGKGFAKNLWPLVYILSDGCKQTAYVGETTDVFSRMQSHLKHEQKQTLTTVHLITSDKFNKSATLDIESNLIQYMFADRQFHLMNSNIGIANHTYYQKQDLYWGIFTDVWDDLRKRGLAKHSIEHINNSELFKYSPYKSLSKSQTEGLVQILEALALDTADNVVVQGGAGTGKTILAIFLFKLLNTSERDLNFEEFGEQESRVSDLVRQIKERYDQLDMAMVIPMSSFRTTVQRIFRGIGGLSAKMVIGPSEATKRKYDLLIVDESHRLRQRVNLGNYMGRFGEINEELGLDKEQGTELDWVLKQSRKAIFFYDGGQSIKPSDVSAEAFNRLIQNGKTDVRVLTSQFRARGGNDYVKFLNNLLHQTIPSDGEKFRHPHYDFKLYTSLEEMVDQIKEKDEKYKLSRLVAGYGWKWVSRYPNRKTYRPFDIHEDGMSLKWNRTSIDWINAEGSVEEVGCIHTTQGYDLNYTGVIFGPEIGMDPKSGQIFVDKKKYFDANGKNTIRNPERLKEYILNIYKTIMLRGIHGTYVYVCDPALRGYMSRYIPLADDAEVDQPRIIPLPSEEVKPFVNSVPLYSLTAAAGGFGPVISAEEQEWIKLPPGRTAGEDLFACRVIGESMNRIIPNGSICLFRRYQGGSRNGKIMLVELNEFTDRDAGAAYTVKEYRSRKQRTDSGYEHERISLLPVTDDSNYKSIELDGESASEMRTIAEFVQVLGK